MLDQTESSCSKCICVDLFPKLRRSATIKKEFSFPREQRKLPLLDTMCANSSLLFPQQFMVNAHIF